MKANLPFPKWCGQCDELGRRSSQWGLNEHMLGSRKLQGRDRKRCQRDVAGAS